MLQKPGINPVVWEKPVACVQLYIYQHLSLPLPVHSALEISLQGHHSENYPHFVFHTQLPRKSLFKTR